MLELGSYPSVMLEVGEGGLTVKLVNFKVGVDVATGDYPLYDEFSSVFFCYKVFL